MRALFKALPTFSFRRNEDGGLEGIVSFEAAAGMFGEMRFYARMHDGAVIDARVGGSSTSAHITFLITVSPHNTPPTFSVRTPTNIACSGTCPCAPSSGQSSGSFSNVPVNWLGHYRNDMNCVWLIASSAEIRLSFSAFDTQSGYDYVTINRCTSSSCSTLQEVARLSGSAVGAGTVYSSSPYTNLQVLFTSDESYGASGFEAHWSVAKATVNLVEDQGTVVLSGFLTDIKPGVLEAEAGQQVSFSLWHVEPIRVFGWHVSASLFEMFSIDVDVLRNTSATLTFRMVPDFAGDVRVVIKLEDDGVGTVGRRLESLVAVNISVAPVNDAPTLQDNGKEHYVCQWHNTTFITSLNESIIFPLVKQNYACNFADDFCGYQKASELNESEARIPWIRSDKRFVPGHATSKKYEGAGPEYGHEAQACRPNHENETFSYAPDSSATGWAFCQKMDYFAVANGFCPSATTNQGEGICEHESSCTPPASPMCKQEFYLQAGDYGFIQSKALRGVVDHTLSPDISGGTEFTLRTDVLTQLTYSFVYNMFDGVPPFNGGDMGSLALQARAAGTKGEGAWTTVWTRVGSQTKYFEWQTVNITFGAEFLQSSGLQVRFVANKRNTENPYTVIAVDSITTPGGEVFRNDRKWKCAMELSVTGVVFDAIRTKEEAFRLFHPPDELITQIPKFTLTVISCTRPCHELFFDKPSATASGTLVLPLTRAGRGRALISVLVEDDGPVGGTLSHQSASPPLTFELTINGYDAVPVFTLQPAVSVLDGSGLERYPRFAVCELLDGLPDSSGAAKENVQYLVRCYSTMPGMWVQHPSIDSLGTLTLEIAPGFTGQGNCSVELDFNIVSAPQFFSIKVWPRPELTSIVPALADPFTNTLVTISGRHFGPVLSRGYAAEAYNVAAFVGTSYAYTVKGIKYSSERWEPCVGGTKYVNDEKLLCTIPPGAGMRHFKVEVIEHEAMNRTGTLLSAFVGVEMWLGGTAEDPHCQAFGAPWPHRQEAVMQCGHRGFIGSGLGPVYLPPKVDMERLSISSSVRALVVAKGRVFMGGSFDTVNSTRVNGIVAYDRQTVRQVGMGLVDGSVSSMALVDRERRLLVVAGSFTRVHQVSGSIISGGIALWDDTSEQWGAIGAVALNGVGLAVQVQGRRIFVAGRFTAIGHVQAANVAVFVSGPHVMSRGIVLSPGGAAQPNCIAGAGGGSWQALADGIQGVVYALAAGSNGDCYAGGRFNWAGGIQVENIARFVSDETTAGGGYWTGLVDSDCLRFNSGVCGINGDVSSIAYVGEYLYVAGQFSSAGGKPVANVARFFSGRWEGVGKGVDGPVHVLSAVRVHDSQSGSCLYFAGDFKKVEDDSGVTEVPGLARWCVGDPINYPRGVLYDTIKEGVTHEYWEKVKLPPGVFSVRSLAPHD